MSTPADRHGRDEIVRRVEAFYDKLRQDAMRGPTIEQVIGFRIS